jgi:hypothetical protein
MTRKGRRWSFATLIVIPGLSNAAIQSLLKALPVKGLSPD